MPLPLALQLIKSNVRVGKRGREMALVTARLPILAFVTAKSAICNTETPWLFTVDVRVAPSILRREVLTFPAVNLSALRLEIFALSIAALPIFALTIEPLRINASVM